ncbi:MAG: hypothetical protein WAL34_04070 [Acidobacteriaceae bacterium]
MDRQIVFIGAIPQDTDLLNTNKNAMVSDGWVAQGILGDSTSFSGLPCSPTSPAGMTVNVGPGCVYAQENIDNSAYGSLNSDTTHQIMKVGVNSGTLNFSCPAPSSSGQSVVYLVEAAFVEQDGGAQVLPYYNAASPATPWSGPSNTGVSQNTVRQNICNVQVKAGVPATTGTQVAPAPDAGYTPLYEVTVANGQTSITSGNVQTVGGAPFISETLTQKISQTTADGRYAQITAVQTNELESGIDSSGAANTITVNLSPVPTAVVQNMTIVVTVANANTGATTLNLNGLGAKSVTRNGNALTGGEMIAGQNYQFSYNGTSWNMMSPPANASQIYNGTAPTTGTANAQVLASVTPGGFSLGYGVVVTFTAGNTNTGATTLNVDGSGAITIKKKGSSGGLVDLAANDLTSTEIYQVIYDGTYWELNSQSFPAASTFFQVANNLSEGVASTMRTNLGLGSAALLSSSAVCQTANNLSDLLNKQTSQQNLGVRTVLTANTTFYVSTSGNDSTGSGTSGAPWATIQHAFNYIANDIDLAGYTATVQLADGTYAAAQVSQPWVGGGPANVILQGNSVTPSNTVITSNSTNSLQAVNTGVGFTYQDLELANTLAGSSCAFAAYGGQLIQGPNVVFGAAATCHISIGWNGIFYLAGSYTIAGGAATHLQCYSNGTIFVGPGITVTLLGTPAFSGAFASVNTGSVFFQTPVASFSGSATGARYSVGLNGVIMTQGSGVNYLPGNGAGTTATGGQYA